MIEKLNLEEVNNPGEATLKAFSILNQLVGAVNELQNQYDSVEQKLNYNPDTTKGLLTLVEEPKPTDPFTEQRKWIGKLCKFRDEETDKPMIGVLKDIDVFVGDNNAFYITFLNAADNNTYFECEPVKLDDDIIYKGGDNE